MTTILNPHQVLALNGWEQQDIPGLWRHPEKAYGAELTTLQAIYVERQGSPRMHSLLAPFVPPPVLS